MRFIKKILRDLNGAINWPGYLALIGIVIFAAYQLGEYSFPLQSFPPLEEIITAIEKTVDPDDFSFAVLGDNKNDKKVFLKILSEIDNDPEISFVVHTGDAVSSSLRYYYRDFLEALEAHLQKPLLIVPGNHDVARLADDGLYERVFGAKHYVFDVGNERFVMMDTNRASSDEEQEWLRQALSSSKGNKNFIVTMHIPLFDPRGEGHHHCMDKPTADKLLEIFRKYGVSHLYTGHLHGYWNGRWGAVPYTITGGAGAKLRSKDPAHGFHHYIKVRIKNGEISEKVIAISESNESMLWYLYQIRVETCESALIIFIIFFALLSTWIRVSHWKRTKSAS